MEKSFRQALTLSGGDPAVFIRSPICLALIIIALGCFLLPVISPRLRAAAKANAEEEEAT
jgi:putative tricarboxylic transport membrane protein